MLHDLVHVICTGSDDVAGTMSGARQLTMAVVAAINR